MLHARGRYNELGDIPFFFEPLATPSNQGYPATLPFAFYFDTELEIFRQRSDPHLSALLRRVYADGSMLGGAMNEGAGRAQAEAAEQFASSVVTDWAGQNVLEIGCGHGYLLKRFYSRGAICTGLEPGPQSGVAQDSELTIIQDFFPSQVIAGRYDVVLNFNVLEHVEDPRQFLAQQVALLTPDGRIILGVPNCEPYVSAGDISMFVHEHYSYFTRRGLQRLAETVECSVESIEVGASGGMLFASLLCQRPVSPLSPLPAPAAAGFIGRAESLLRGIASLTAGFPQEQLAVFCPIRAMNALCLLGTTRARLVDDDAAIQGKYIPGLENAVEGFTSIRQRPPAAIFIFSRTFGRDIQARCREASSLNQSTIYTMVDVDAMSSVGALT